MWLLWYRICTQRLSYQACRGYGYPWIYPWTLCWHYLSNLTRLLVICSRNRVPGPGSKIDYSVPNTGNNWYPVFALIENACLCISLCDDIYFPLCYDCYCFCWCAYSHLIIHLRTFSAKKKQICEKCSVIGRWPLASYDKAAVFVIIVIIKISIC